MAGVGVGAFMTPACEPRSRSTSLSVEFTSGVTSHHFTSAGERHFVFELVKFRFLLGFTWLLCGQHLVHWAGSTDRVRLLRYNLKG